MANGSISFNTSAASKSNIPTCAATGSRNICSTGSRWTTHQNTTQRNNSTNLTGSPRNGSPTIPAKAKPQKARAELVTLEFNEQILHLWDEWESITGADANNPDDFIAWAMENKKLLPHLQDVRRLLRKQVATALRQALRADE